MFVKPFSCCCCCYEHKSQAGLGRAPCAGHQPNEFCPAAGAQIKVYSGVRGFGTCLPFGASLLADTCSPEFGVWASRFLDDLHECISLSEAAFHASPPPPFVIICSWEKCWQRRGHWAKRQETWVTLGESQPL